jgi:hypothetical protein
MQRVDTKGFGVHAFNDSAAFDISRATISQ